MFSPELVLANAPVNLSCVAVIVIGPGAPEPANTQLPELVSAVADGIKLNVQLPPRLSLRRTWPLGLNTVLLARTVTSSERCGLISNASQKIRTLPPQALGTGVSIAKFKA